MKDIYTEVTNRIITALEAGTPPWICPWTDHTALPSNLATGKPYRGINVLMLSIEADMRSYSDSRWVTYKQAAEVGAHIKKGEHGTERTRFDHQFHGDQYRVESMDRYGGQHLRHYLVATRMPHQAAPQLLEWRRQVSKGRTVS